MTDSAAEIIGLDYGLKKIGVARMNMFVKIAEPLDNIVVTESDSLLTTLEQLIARQQASAVVVGLPRRLDGQESEQTVLARNFATWLKANSDIRVYLIDEAGTSIEAKRRMMDGKKGSIDGLSACQLLEDFATLRLDDRNEVL